MTTTDLRYPIGKYTPPSTVSAEQRARWIGEIAELPGAMRAAVAGLHDQQLDTPYREGGWTVRQVVHHVPDSHMNAYVRFRLALTEEQPTIRPYEEAEWAKLSDARSAPIELSLSLLEPLHARWVLLLRSMDAAAWSRTYFHPEQQAHVRLDHVLGMYAWHGRHHVAHVTGLRERMRW